MARPSKARRKRRDLGLPLPFPLPRARITFGTLSMTYMEQALMSLIDHTACILYCTKAVHPQCLPRPIPPSGQSVTVAHLPSGFLGMPTILLQVAFLVLPSLPTVLSPCKNDVRKEEEGVI